MHNHANNPAHNRQLLCNMATQPNTNTNPLFKVNKLECSGSKD